MPFGHWGQEMSLPAAGSLTHTALIFDQVTESTTPVAGSRFARCHTLTAATAIAEALSGSTTGTFGDHVRHTPHAGLTTLVPDRAGRGS